MSDSLIPSFLMSNVSESLRSLTKNEWCERIAQVAHQKWATLIKLLRLLTKNEQISDSLKKMNNLLRKPTSEFPALTVTLCPLINGQSVAAYLPSKADYIDHKNISAFLILTTIVAQQTRFLNIQI